MWLLLAASTALGGTVYFNGVLVDGRDLAGASFEQVDVRFDDDGVVHIRAVGYEVEVIDPSGSAPAPVGTPAPMTSAPVSSAPAGVAGSGRWWLVAEDSGSVEQELRVYVNDALVTTLRSGEPNSALDLGRWLLPGENRLRVESQSSGLGGAGMSVHVGKGRAESEVVIVDIVEVEHRVPGTSRGRMDREYTLFVGG